MITGVAVPAVVWLLMLVVGLELTAADFRRVLLYPKAVAVATIGQLMLLPLTAALLIWALKPPPYVTAGMVLVAASPGGAISNFYAYLARANVALSVTLTAVSSLVALAAMPILMSLGFALFLDPVGRIPVPVAEMAVQLAGMLIFPVALGMALRRWQRALVERHARGARRFSLLALAALIGFILLEEYQRLDAGGGSVVIAAVWFSLIAMAAGWVVGRLAGLDAADRFTLLLEFAARNLAIAALVGIVVLERAELVLFATVFFLVQLPILLPLVGACAARAKRRAAPPT